MRASRAQQSAANVEQTASAARVLSSSINELVDKAAVFKLEIDDDDLPAHAVKRAARPPSNADRRPSRATDSVAIRQAEPASTVKSSAMALDD